MSFMHIFVKQKMTFTLCCYRHSTAHDCMTIPFGLTHISSIRKPSVIVSTAKFIFNLHNNGLSLFRVCLKEVTENTENISLVYAGLGGQHDQIYTISGQDVTRCLSK